MELIPTSMLRAGFTFILRSRARGSRKTYAWNSPAAFRHWTNRQPGRCNASIPLARYLRSTQAVMSPSSSGSTIGGEAGEVVITSAARNLLLFAAGTTVGKQQIPRGLKPARDDNT